MLHPVLSKIAFGKVKFMVKNSFYKRKIVDSCFEAVNLNLVNLCKG